MSPRVPKGRRNRIKGSVLMIYHPAEEPGDETEMVAEILFTLPCFEICDDVSGEEGEWGRFLGEEPEEILKRVYVPAVAGVGVVVA